MKLECPDFKATDSAIIALPPDGFYLSNDAFNHNDFDNNAIEVEGERFTPKEEHHVTLIGSKLGLLIQKKIRQDPAINALLEEIFIAIDWSYQRTDSIHLLSRCKKGVTEKSIILLLDMPGVAKFYAQLKSHGLIDADTPVPPAHVTLYTLNCPMGIGVPSDKALRELSIKSLSFDALR